MRRIHCVSIALISFLTPYVAHAQEVVAQSSQRSLSGVWTNKGDGFHADDSGCHAGSRGAASRFKTPEFTIVQTGNSISVPGNFGGWASSDGSGGGYGNVTVGTILGNKFTLTSQAGPFTNEYTGTISNDGNTITGQVLCRVSTGSATATASFTFTRREETKRIKVWLMGFIPDQIADIGLPVGEQQCSHGDGRGFPLDIRDAINETRYRIRDLVEFEVKLDGEKVTDVRFIDRTAKTGETRLVNCQTGDLLPGTGHIDTAPTDGMRYNWSRENNLITVEFSGLVKHPLIKDAPPIQYDIKAIINPIQEEAEVIGFRKTYPAYEMYVLFRDQDQSEREAKTVAVVQKMPDGWTRRPLDLFGPADAPVSDSESSGRQVGEWFGEQVGQDAAEDIFRNPSNPSPSTPPFDGFSGGDSGGGGSSTLW
ncbi:MAG: hypothetical protein LDL41_13230 [Coleofasciculus sp. S288]|nr:hypothetical protein [Coleofasciculus sp. S288]